MAPLDPEAGPSSLPYAHISRASAAQAIQHLDAFAFPSVLPRTTETPKRRKVSDVEANNLEHSNQTHIRSLAGMSMLHRERARQRNRRRTPKEHNSGSIWSGEPTKQNSSNEHASTYQPFSLPLLLGRLANFTASTFSSKPESCKNLDPVSLAMHGWKHEIGKSKDTITCATCQAEWKAEVAGDLDRVAKNQAWQDLDAGVPSKHLPWCPWRLRGCHSSLYRIPVHTKFETISEISKGAQSLMQCEGIEDVQLVSPIEEVILRRLGEYLPEGLGPNAIVLSLLGWTPSEEARPVKDCVLHCNMCLRKIGLWSFRKGQASARTLDVLREHRSYCPYINAKIQSGMSTQASGQHLNAWQQRMQILLGTSYNSDSARLPLRQEQVRKMRTSDVLAQVKNFMM